MRTQFLALALTLTLTIACTPEDVDTETGTDTGPAGTSSTGITNTTGTETDTGTQTDTGTDTDTGTESGTDTGAQPCVEDLLEPNNGKLVAHPLVVGQTLTDLASLSGDADWYSLVVPANTQLEIRALFAHSDGNVDMRAHDTLTPLFGTIDSTDDNETAWIRNETSNAVEWFIEIYLSDGSCNLYDLQVVVN